MNIYRTTTSKKTEKRFFVFAPNLRGFLGSERGRERVRVREGGLERGWEGEIE